MRTIPRLPLIRQRCMRIILVTTAIAVLSSIFGCSNWIWIKTTIEQAAAQFRQMEFLTMRMLSNRLEITGIQGITGDSRLSVWRQVVAFD